MAEVKKELSKLYGTEPTSTESSASSSKVAEANQSKPNDISYLVKRKKPSGSNSSFEQGSPAKKPTM